MECNKDEAAKCKAIAEASLKKVDLLTAKRFALKAKQLFPELDGLPQLSSVIDVFAAAHPKLKNGESNWYAILQVDFRADENTIRKQYRKLALFLHPDKNKAFGAETAFKHISEAWSVLSDGKKKSDYDKRWFAFMAARRAGLQQNATAFRARENLKKQQLYTAFQSQQRMQQDQLNRQSNQGLPRHLHGKQGLCAQHQGSFPVNANQQQWQGYAHASKQQEPNTHQQINRQEQGHSHAQQQPQCQATLQADQCQHQGNEHGQSQDYEQREERSMHVKKQESTLHNRQGQDCARTYQQQCQYQSTAYKQKVDDRTQKQQPTESCTEQTCQTEVPIQQQDYGLADAHPQLQNQENSHGHQQQQQQQRQQGNTSCLQQQESHVRCQGKTKDPKQQDESESCADRQQGQVKMHAQRQGSGESLGSLQAQHHARVKEHVRSQEDHHKQQGQNEIGVGVRQQHEELKEVCLNNFAFSMENSAFWTACPYCKMQFEYEKAYMNKKLCCPMCDRPFFSKEILPVQGAIIWQRPMLKEVSEEEAGRKNGTTDISGRIPGADANVSGPMLNDKKAKRDEKDSATHLNFCRTPAVAVSAKEGKVQEQKQQMGVCETVGVPRTPVRLKYRGNCAAPASQRVASDLKLKMPSSSTSAVQNVGAVSEQFASAGLVEKKTNSFEQRISRLRTVNLARTKENGGPLGKVDVNNSRVQTRNSAKAKETKGLQQGSSLSSLGSLKFEVPGQKRKTLSYLSEAPEDITSATKRLRQAAIQSETNVKTENGSDDHEFLRYSKSPEDNMLPGCVTVGVPGECEMEVPDSDFYNFDGDRTESHFSVGQIWATYDDDDGMPRYYARVNKILSITPFKLQMNWLEARNPTHETLAWLGAGFQHICGDFMLGSVYVADQVSTFSHLMTVDKVSKGHYKIYPRKGDVWAVYKEWELLKSKEDHREYKMVEITATYDEKRGVEVATLFKVTGFKTIFESKSGVEHRKCIPLHEMRRFSHQVPARLVEPGKVPSIQGYCLEIDPASTPMSLITGSNEEVEKPGARLSSQV